jgi:phospholipid/cholesterol/gamma-HCH transport system substrate-binding protein
MTAARGLALAALLVAAVLVGVLLLGGDGGSTYQVRFENAGQLVKDDDVQVGGRRIGSIKQIKLTDDNQADIEI